MSEIFTYIWLKFMVNVGKYSIHGAFGQKKSPNLGTSGWSPRLSETKIPVNARIVVVGASDCGLPGFSETCRRPMSHLSSAQQK